MRKTLCLLTLLTILLIFTGCRVAIKSPTGESNGTQVTDAVLIEDKLTLIPFNVDGTNFKIEIPGYFQEEQDGFHDLNLVGERGDIFIEGARKLDMDGIEAFKDVYLKYYLDNYKETMRKDSLKTEKLKIAGFPAEKTSLEMVEDGFVFQYEGYIVETEDAYLLINVSGKKSFFNNEVDYLKVLNSLEVDKLAEGTGKKI